MTDALPVPAVGRIRKGDLTRAAIVEAALALASRKGLEGLTLGGLADVLGMSKSGVVAHFGSREELQLAVLQAYAQQFLDQVLGVAVKQARGLPRLRAIAECWLNFLTQALKSGCILIGGATEYDDRDGALRALMVELVSGWQAELVKAVRLAAQEGHVRRDVDAQQVAFELYGILLATHQAARLLRAQDAVARARVSVERLLRSIATPAGLRALTATWMATMPVRRGLPRARRAPQSSTPTSTSTSTLRPTRITNRSR